MQRRAPQASVAAKVSFVSNVNTEMHEEFVRGAKPSVFAYPQVEGLDVSENERDAG